MGRPAGFAGGEGLGGRRAPAPGSFSSRCWGGRKGRSGRRGFRPRSKAHVSQHSNIAHRCRLGSMAGQLVMEVSLFHFSAKQLQTIHTDHLGFLIASSHCCNELICVMPYIIFEQDIEEANEVERALINIRFFTIVRHQIAKIFEYRDLCNDYVGKICKTFPSLAESVQEETKLISRQIGTAKWAQTVRNKVAFHFDGQYAAEILSRTPPDQELAFIAGRYRGLTAFDFADRIIVEAMFLDAGNGDRDVGQDTVKQWTIELQRQIEQFHAKIVGQIFKQYGIFQNEEISEIRDTWCAVPGQIAIPLSTRGSLAT